MDSCYKVIFVIQVYINVHCYSQNLGQWNLLAYTGTSSLEANVETSDMRAAFSGTTSYFTLAGGLR